MPHCAKHVGHVIYAQSDWHDFSIHAFKTLTTRTSMACLAHHENMPIQIH